MTSKCDFSVTFSPQGTLIFAPLARRNTTGSGWVPSGPGRGYQLSYVPARTSIASRGEKRKSGEPSPPAMPRAHCPRPQSLLSCFQQQPWVPKVAKKDKKRAWTHSKFDAHVAQWFCISRFVYQAVGHLRIGQLFGCLEYATMPHNRTQSRGIRHTD